MKKDKKEKTLGHDCRIKQMAETMRNMNHGEIAADVLGSYTGMTKEGYEPEQDADDL